MNILITGIHGFVGTNLVTVLKAKYTIYGLDIVSLKKDGIVKTFLWDELQNIPNIDIVIHAAGKAHFVPKTEVEKQSFFDINYQLTVNLCKVLKETCNYPKSFIFISTVAVYGCDFGENITEEHPLNGNTPYALSKIQAEQFLTDWCKNNNVILSIIRPSLIAGSNPQGNLQSMIKGIKAGKYYSVAGGKAKKSILMVQDIANLVPLLAKKGGIYNVCDDEQPTFFQLENLISKQLCRKRPLSIPLWLAKIFALIGDLFGTKAPINSLKLKKITESLTFSNKKAKKELCWKPLNVLENFEIF